MNPEVEEKSKRSKDRRLAGTSPPKPKKDLFAEAMKLSHLSTEELWKRGIELCGGLTEEDLRQEEFMRQIEMQRKSKPSYATKMRQRLEDRQKMVAARQKALAQQRDVTMTSPSPRAALVSNDNKKEDEEESGHQETPDP